MTNEELKREIVAEIKGIQSKYIYYVIALNVAAVGYSIHHVQGQSFNWSHYLLGSAIIFWSIGVFLGFQFLFNIKQVSHIAYNFLELFDELVRTMPANVINTTIKSKIDAKSIALQERANGYYKWSLFSFYIGCLLFVIWQAIQMIYFVPPVATSCFIV